MMMFKQFKKSSAFLLVVLGLLMTGCGKSSEYSEEAINIAKMGLIPHFDGETIETGLEEYFDEPKWKYYEEDGDRYVKFTGSFLFDNEESVFDLDLKVVLDREEVLLSEGYVNGEQLESSELDEVMYVIADHLFEIGGNINPLDNPAHSEEVNMIGKTGADLFSEYGDMTVLDTNEYYDVISCNDNIYYIDFYDYIVGVETTQPSVKVFEVGLEMTLDEVVKIFGESQESFYDEESGYNVHTFYKQGYFIDLMFDTDTTKVVEMIVTKGI